MGSITRKPELYHIHYELRDNDNDGIFDIIDADKNNDGILDEPGTDDNANGIIDDADNDTNYSFGIVRYQSCDGLDVKNNIIRGVFSKWNLPNLCYSKHS